MTAAAARGAVRGGGRIPWPLPAAALLCAVYAAAGWITPGWFGLDADRLPLARDAGLVVVAALAAASCGWYARTAPGRRRAGWLLLTGSQTALAAGLLARGAAEPVRGWPEPGQAPSGPLLAVGLLLAAAALALFADRRPRVPALWLCRVLDAWIIVGALLALVWSLALLRTGHVSPAGLPRIAATHVLPALGTLTIGAVLAVLLRAAGRNGAMLVNVSLVVLAGLAVGDALLSRPPAAPGSLPGATAAGAAAVLHGPAGFGGGALHLGRFAGSLALACAPWVERWNRRRPRGRPAFGLPVLSRLVRAAAGPAGRPGALCAALTPYLAAAICAAALAWPIAERRDPDPVTLACCAAVTVALLVRQGVTLVQNVWLTRELADKESHFRSLVQGSSDVIMIAGPDGRLRYVSPAAQRVYDRPAESLAGTRLRDLIHPEDRRTVLAAVRRFLHERPGHTEAARLECRIRSGSGAWLHVESTVSRYADGLILNSRDVTDRVRLQAQLQHHAFHDPLTDLPNRTLFAERTRQALARGVPDPGGPRGSGHPDGEPQPAAAILYVDLDGFKAVNDAAGHDAGDELLIQVARRLEHSVRSGDTVARLGGDEFAALICGDVERRDLVEIAERLLEELSRPCAVGGLTTAVAASIGIAFAEPDISPAELLRNADLAMYRAKAEGKSRVEVYAPQMRADLLRRSVLDRRLRAATRDGEFTLLHQPVVGLGARAAAPPTPADRGGGGSRGAPGRPHAAASRTAPPGTVVALEAHVRWRSSRGALLTPAEFLRSPESGERAAELAGWAVARAVEQASRRGVEHGIALPVTVRLPAAVVRREDFADRVAAALDATGLPPGRLIVELTGSGPAAAFAATGEAVDALHRTGVLIGLGGLWAATGAPADPSAGTLSLEALHRWPLAQLRLDSAMVRGISTTAAADHEASRLRRLTRGVLRMAHELGLLVVADGVGRVEQADALRALGCDRAQGLLYGAPMSEQDLHPALAPGHRPGPRGGGQPTARLPAAHPLSTVPGPRRGGLRQQAERMPPERAPAARGVPAPAATSDDDHPVHPYGETRVPRA